MIFENEEAENAYMRIVEEYGYLHINSSKAITLNDLKTILESLRKLNRKRENTNGNKRN